MEPTPRVMRIPHPCMCQASRPGPGIWTAHSSTPSLGGHEGAGRSIREKPGVAPKPRPAWHHQTLCAIVPLCLYVFVPLCLCSSIPNTSKKADSVLKEENHVSLIPAFDFCLDVLVQGIKVVSLMRLHIIVSQGLLKGCF